MRPENAALHRRESDDDGDDDSASLIFNERLPVQRGVRQGLVGVPGYVSGRKQLHTANNKC